MWGCWFSFWPVLPLKKSLARTSQSWEKQNIWNYFYYKFFLTAGRCLHQPHSIFSQLPNVLWHRYVLLRSAEDSLSTGFLGLALQSCPWILQGCWYEVIIPTAGFVDTHEGRGWNREVWVKCRGVRNGSRHQKKNYKKEGKYLGLG